MTDQPRGPNDSGTETMTQKGASGRTGSSLGETTAKRGDPGSGSDDDRADQQDPSDDQGGADS
jgi:hypothetical protein